MVKRNSTLAARKSRTVSESPAQTLRRGAPAPDRDALGARKDSVIGVIDGARDCLERPLTSSTV